jgi:membrane protein
MRAPEMPRLMSEAWYLLRKSFAGFLNDNALSHSAAMAFYAVTSLAPTLLVVVAIAGLAFGNDAAQVALSAQISGLMGPESADLFETVLASAAGKAAGSWATIIGLATLLITISGVFGEMQLALNTIWRVEPSDVSISRLVRARAASLGLVAALGFLLLVSLAASAAITAFGDLLNASLPFGEVILAIVNGIVSFILVALMFGASKRCCPTAGWNGAMWRSGR